MSLRELFDLAETGNSEIRANQIHADAARQGIDVAQASKLPDVTAALDLSYIGDGTIIDRDFSRAMRDKLPHFGNALSVNVYQPLFTGGAITGGIEMAQHNALMADINLSQTRSGIRYQPGLRQQKIVTIHNFLTKRLAQVFFLLYLCAT